MTLEMMFSKTLIRNTLTKKGSSPVVLTQLAAKTFFQSSQKQASLQLLRGSSNRFNERMMTSLPRFTMSTSEEGNTSDFTSLKSEGSQKKITAKTLCDITGTKYYIHNEEINFSANKKVRVYDENDVLIGDLTFSEALTSAKAAKKDLVLRQEKADPPICKIMGYKMELLKKLFKKLGRQQTEEKESKSKTIRLTTTIAMHDLENKKRKAIDFLKQHANLKFYMKVNIYDDENIQKGRLMLMNIAEDLKEYAKIKVSPMDDQKGE